MMVGLLDQASTFYNADVAFPIYKKLRVQVIRVDLYWGGNDLAVSKRRPVHAADPADPAYNWDVYDRVVSFAEKYNISCSSRSGERRGGRTAARPGALPEELRRPAEVRVRRRQALQRHVPGQERQQARVGATLDCVERAEPALPALPAVQARPWQIRHAECDQLREDLHRGLHRRPLDAAEGREGRVRRHRSRRKRQPAWQARLADADVVHDGGQEGASAEVRRVGAQPVRRPEGDAVDEATRSRAP